MPPDDIISNDVLDTALPRVTDDVDLTRFTGLGTEAPFIDAPPPPCESHRALTPPRPAEPVLGQVRG